MNLLNEYFDLKNMLVSLNENKMFKLVKRVRSINLINISDLTISMTYASPTIEAIAAGKKGFYVDVGCCHPIMYNNTCLLHKKGWSGINIDLNKTSIDLFKIMRPNDYNICAAMSDINEERDLFFDHYFSPVNTLSESVYNSADKNISFKKFNKKKILTTTFDDIVKNISISFSIDFLNIDCEGFDYLVLKGFNIKKYNPKLICIETHDVNGNPVKMYNEITNFLKNVNYSFLKRCGPSSFFQFN